MPWYFQLHSKAKINLRDHNIQSVRSTGTHLGKEMAIPFSVNKTGKVTVNQQVGVIQDGIKPAPRGEQSLEKINTTAFTLPVFSAGRDKIYCYFTSSGHHKIPSCMSKDTWYTKQGASSML